MQKTATKTEITSAAIAHCIMPETRIVTSAYGHEVRLLKGQTVYSVKSDTSDETYYVRWDSFWDAWNCTCKATIAQGCKHRRAVQEVIAAKTEHPAASEWQECTLCTRKTRQGTCGVCLGERR